MPRLEPVTQGVVLLGPATPLRAAVLSRLEQQRTAMRSLSVRIQEQFRQTLDDMHRRRRSLFFGSTFEESAT